MEADLDHRLGRQITFKTHMKTKRVLSAFDTRWELSASCVKGFTIALVAGAWTERKKIFHGGSFLKLADDNMDIQNPEAQNRELSGF